MDMKGRLTAEERAWLDKVMVSSEAIACCYVRPVLEALDAAEVVVSELNEENATLHRSLVASRTEVAGLRSVISEFDGMTCDRPCEHEHCRRIRLVRVALGKEDKPNGKPL